MPKLKLEIDALRVESFDTSATPMGAGTVRAHGEAVEEDYVAITTPQSQQPSCFGSCNASCNGGCTDLCSLGCSDGCTQRTCASGAPVCCA